MNLPSKLRSLLLAGAALALAAPAFAASPIVNYAETAGNTTTASTVTDSGSFTVTGGDTLVVLMNSCGGSVSCTTTSATRVSGIAKKSGTGTLGTCALATGASPGASAVDLDSEVWYCPITASGNMVVEATWGAAIYYGNIGLVDVAGSLTDDGKGNYASGTGVTPSVSTNGSTTQANEIIVASAYPDQVTGDAAGTGYTLFSGSIYNEYSLTNSAGSNTATLSAPDNAGDPYGIAIAAFKTLGTPKVVVYNPPAPQLIDSAASGATIAGFTVTMSDGSTYSGTDTMLHGSDPLCTAPASGNGNVTLSRTLTSADVGNHTCLLQVTANNVNLEANLIFNVAKAVEFSDTTTILPGQTSGQVLGVTNNGAWGVISGQAGPQGPQGIQGVPGPVGAQGIQGPQGAQGVAGQNAGQQGLFTPTGSTMACTQGQSGFDASYLYLCVANNNWGRLSLSGLQTTGW